MVGDQLKTEGQKELLKLSELSLQIDSYDDIFSDFDPRPFSQRALSDDFLQEAKRASRDKSSGTFLLQFMMPKDRRSIAEEQLIKRRLKEHFKKHYLELIKEVGRVKREGSLLIASGIIVALVGGYVGLLAEQSFFAHVGLIVLEPASWFCIWTGFDRLFFTWREQAQALHFYEKMSNADVVFESY